MTLTLARDLHGACPRCPQPSWHNGAPCPLWGAAKERERGVPCARCRRLTWRNDQLCDCCASSVARVAVGGRVSARPAPSFSPAGATDALQPPAGDHP